MNSLDSPDFIWVMICRAWSYIKCDCKREDVCSRQTFFIFLLRLSICLPSSGVRGLPCQQFPEKIDLLELQPLYPSCRYDANTQEGTVINLTICTGITPAPFVNLCIFCTSLGSARDPRETRDSFTFCFVTIDVQIKHFSCVRKIPSPAI